MRWFFALIVRCLRGSKSKVALMCDVERDAVIECADVSSIYERAADAASRGA